MKRLFYTLAFLFLFSSWGWSEPNRIFPAHNGLTGGTEGTLDNIDACNADGRGYDLQDKDGAIVWNQDDAQFWFYIYDADDGTAESSPDIITPDNCEGSAYTGDGRWEVSGIYGATGLIGLGSWKIVYVDSAGEIATVPLGADDTFFTSKGAGAAPEMRVLVFADIPALDALNLTELTSEPASPSTKKVYLADGTTWDPAGISIGKAYYCGYDGADWFAIRDEDGDIYTSGIEWPTLLNADLNDDSSPHDLIASEQKSKIISNDGESSAHVYNSVAQEGGLNFCFMKEEDYDMTVNPDGTETWYFRTDNAPFAALGAGENIENASAGKSMLCCFSTASGVFCTGDTNWDEETP